jgi:hypothetical protein
MYNAEKLTLVSQAGGLIGGGGVGGGGGGGVWMGVCGCVWKHNVRRTGGRTDVRIRKKLNASHA